MNSVFLRLKRTWFLKLPHGRSCPQPKGHDTSSEVNEPDGPDEKSQTEGEKSIQGAEKSGSPALNSDESRSESESAQKRSDVSPETSQFEPSEGAMEEVGSVSV